MMEKTEKLCFIADTPFQVFNVLNIQNSLNKDRILYADLFIGEQFSNAKKLADNIRAKDIFRRVILFSPHLDSYRNGFQKAIEIASPRFRANLMLQNFSLKHRNIYNVVFITMITHFSEAMFFMNPKADLYYYDEGLSSYIGDNGPGYSDLKHKFLYALFGHDLNKMYPKGIYVNNPTFCDTKVTNNKFPINRMNNDQQRRIYEIFEYTESDILEHRRVVYLTQPMNEICSTEYVESDTVKNALSNYRDDVIIRKHPRENTVANDEFLYDKSGMLWELVCSSEISNSHILIAAGSTTLLVPKLMFNKEPFLIFTYNLFPITDEWKEKFRDISRRIQIMYSDKAKVFIPNTVDEMKAYLNTVLNR